MGRGRSSASYTATSAKWWLWLPNPRPVGTSYGQPPNNRLQWMRGLACSHADEGLVRRPRTTDPCVVRPPARIAAAAGNPSPRRPGDGPGLSHAAGDRTRLSCRIAAHTWLNISHVPGQEVGRAPHGLTISCAGAGPRMLSAGGKSCAPAPHPLTIVSLGPHNVPLCLRVSGDSSRKGEDLMLKVDVLATILVQANWVRDMNEGRAFVAHEFHRHRPRQHLVNWNTHVGEGRAAGYISNAVAARPSKILFDQAFAELDDAV